jgi:hypothetical protein
MTDNIRDDDVAPDALVSVAPSPQKPRIVIEDGPNGPVATVQVAPEAVRLLGGSDEKEFNALILAETLLCARVPVGGGAPERLAAVAAALGAFKPKDEIDAMFAAQAVALHFSTIECLRRAMIPEQPFEIASKLRKDGANLARCMADMIEALDRKRGKGPQVVRVERVVVHDGGQAIVGAVSAGASIRGRGEG